MSCASFWDGLQAALLTVACFGFGGALWGYWQTLKVSRRLEERQKRVTDMLDKVPASYLLVGAATWRDLDPVGRQVFRKALADVLAEMNAEPEPVVH